MMQSTLIVRESDWRRLDAHFAGSGLERMAFGLCGGTVAGEAGPVLLLRSLDIPVEQEYRNQGPSSVSLNAAYAPPRAVRARETGAVAWLDAHSHPFASEPWPSCVDERGAMEQARLFLTSAPGVWLLRMIFSGSGAIWAAASPTDSIRWEPIQSVVVLSPHRRLVITPVNAPHGEAPPGDDPHHLRTRAVLRRNGEQTLAGVHAMVIGLGGTGQALVRQLSGYIRDWTLVDPDVVELHNAPRLHYYREGDVGMPKVEAVARGLREAFPDRRVQVIAAPFPDGVPQSALRRADLIFCCPDSHTVRYAAAVEAARWMQPLIEVGCGGKRAGGTISALGYHVRLQAPDGPCLVCNGLDIRDLEDPTSTAGKRRAGYLGDDGTVPGELMSLTTRAAADAAEIAIRFLTGYAEPAAPTHIYYDALQFRSVDLTGSGMCQAGCHLCSTDSDSIAGVGDGGETEAVLACPKGGDNAAA
jgi:molybdopterin/thiamine biosynthesis adenylyltransferase